LLLDGPEYFLWFLAHIFELGELVGQQNSFGKITVNNFVAAFVAFPNHQYLLGISRVYPVAIIMGVFIMLDK